MKNSYSFIWSKKKKIIIKISNKVFKPTGTSEALLKTVTKNIKSNGDVLDLGSGSGLVGLGVKKFSKKNFRLHASDISQKACNLVKSNAKKNKIKIKIKSGNLFSPWRGYKFCYIINDVSGISSKVALISPWFKNTSCASGIDGTKLIINVLRKAKNYLNDNGKIFFPVLSLSNEKKIIKEAKKNFKSVKKLSHHEWLLPSEMKKKTKILIDLKRKGHISFKNKFGLIIWHTDIYVASNVK